MGEDGAFGPETAAPQGQAPQRPSVLIRGERRKGMGSHSKPVNGATVEWYTPPGLFRALSIDFDLDPCAPAGGLPWIPARRFISLPSDGLTEPWGGRVWLNPPYGQHTALWMRRLAAHGDGLALIFARTETEWWHETVPAASAVCFIAGRLTFVDATGQDGIYNAGAPSALVAFGDECAASIAASGLGMTFAVNARGLAGDASLWEAAGARPSAVDLSAGKPEPQPEGRRP